mmetsp:Transcript_87625/g.277014  ORF Transcript_87625/g.277014 Transcript_87625/m.277014 type:complete len:343 (-) Transcript_87625:15-1043(-)
MAGTACKGRVSAAASARPSGRPPLREHIGGLDPWEHRRAGRLAAACSSRRRVRATMPSMRWRLRAAARSPLSLVERTTSCKHCSLERVALLSTFCCSRALRVNSASSSATRAERPSSRLRLQPVASGSATRADMLTALPGRRPASAAAPAAWPPSRAAWPPSRAGRRPRITETGRRRDSCHGLGSSSAAAAASRAWVSRRSGCSEAARSGTSGVIGSARRTGDASGTWDEAGRGVGGGAAAPLRAPPGSVSTAIPSSSTQSFGSRIGLTLPREMFLCSRARKSYSSRWPRSVIFTVSWPSSKNCLRSLSSDASESLHSSPIFTWKRLIEAGAAWVKPAPADP